MAKENIENLVKQVQAKGKSWIQAEKGLPEEAIIWAEKFAEPLATGASGKYGMKTNQIRKFFGEIKKIQAKGFESDNLAFRMLKPQLAYAAARDKNKQGKVKSTIGFYEQALSSLISSEVVNNAKQFSNFVHLNQAIVAYHKKYSKE